MKVYAVINEDGIHSIFLNKKDAQDMVDACKGHEIEAYEVIE